MSKLVCRQEKINKTDLDELLKICPFHAIEEKGGRIEINSGCRMCMLCIKNGPPGVIELTGDEDEVVDKSLWKGIAVYAEHLECGLHPVTMELIGKARELASAAGEPVYCLLAGYEIAKEADILVKYGTDEVFIYDAPELKHFRIEPYTAVFEDFIRKVKPSSLLVGATPTGRSLAPRVAARFRTGLTADCTRLERKDNTDLVQIRPAFGGNIMAQILCSKTRPQIATVRYKVMNAPDEWGGAQGKITVCDTGSLQLTSGIKIIKVQRKAAEVDISDADAIVAVGRALKTEKDMIMIRELAELLGARIAGTRPMIEAGYIHAKQQIGLSGRTVKPKVIITLGISGSVQFAAGMSGSEQIFAVNTDSNAQIFNIAHYGIVGDLYEIVPRLIENIKRGCGVRAGAGSCGDCGGGTV